MFLIYNRCGDIMKIKDGFILKEIADSYIVVPLRERIDDFSAVINLNETSALIWKCLEKGATKEELVDKLMSKYDVDKPLAESDVDKFIEKLKEANLLEV